ncbi:MAG TPA: hypothetical protein VFZ73_17780 [Gemmatimonadaceae bacterium]
MHGLMVPGRLLLCLLGLLLGTNPGLAQVVDTARARTDSARARSAQFPDSLRPPLSPGRAFLTSLMVPGLGQSRLGRQLPGAVYATVEVMSVVMLLKAKNDLRIARGQAAARIVNRYSVDPATGAPLLDPGGLPIPQDTVANRFDVERVEARRTQVEDWIAVLAFNHLFAGADAFVAALLWDLPARVGAQRLTRGFGIGLSVRW